MNQTDTTRSPARCSWVVALGMFVVLLPGLRTISHSDFWMHLASGQQGFTRLDPFTRISEGASWINTNWLYDWMLATIWGWGGAVGVTLLHMLAVGVAFYLLVRLLRPLVSDGALALALCVAAWLLAPQFLVRPGVFSLLFASIFLVMLSRSAWNLKTFAVLLPVQIVWANMHISFLWGPVITALFAVQTYFAQPQGVRSFAPVLPAIGWVVALLVATCVNPFGVGLYGGLEGAFAGALYRDWISPVSGLFDSRLAGGVVTVALIIGAVGLLTCKQPLPVALTAVAMVGALLAVRSVATGIHWFALLSFPFLAISLQAAGDLISSKLPQISHTLFGGWGGATGVVGVALLSMFSLVSNRYFISTGSFSSFGLGVNKAATAYSALPVLQHDEFPERWVHLPMDGGFLAYALPDRQTFIDDRVGVHGRLVFGQLTAALSGQTEAWNQLMRDYEPDAIVINNLWSRSAEAVRSIGSQPDWEPLYFDGSTTILIRNVTQYPQLAAQREAIWQEGQRSLEESRRSLREQIGRFRQPPLSAALLGAAPIFMANNQFQQAAACYGLLQVQAPRMSLVSLNLGICQRYLGNHAAAVRELSRAVDRVNRESSEWLTAHLNLGISQLALGDSASAIRHLRVVNQVAPDQVWGWLYLSQAYQQSGQSIDARQSIERARSLNPELTEQFLRGSI